MAHLPHFLPARLDVFYPFGPRSIGDKEIADRADSRHLREVSRRRHDNGDITQTRFHESSWPRAYLLSIRGHVNGGPPRELGRLPGDLVFRATNRALDGQNLCGRRRRRRNGRHYVGKENVVLLVPGRELSVPVAVIGRAESLT